MPARIIRDELLHSERYWSVSDEAKLLYIHLLISADDTARYTGKNFSLRSRCFPGRGMEANRMEILLSELADQDLIRPYHFDKERYIFIPRFKQRLRYVNSKYPEPPNEINDLAIEKSVPSQTQDRPKTAPSQTQVSRSEVKRSEVKLREAKLNTPEGVSDSVFQDYIKLRKGLKAPVTETAIKGLAKEAALAGMTLQQVMEICCQNGWRGFKASWMKEKEVVGQKPDKMRSFWDQVNGGTAPLIGGQDDL